MLDFDRDGTPDFVVATQAIDSGASGAHLSVISGATGDRLWQSVAMGSGYDRIIDVLIEPPESPAGASELIAVLPGSLRAYNSDTQFLDWVLPVDNDGATRVDNGLAGSELMVWRTDGSVSFYDAATRAHLRDMALSSPLAGIIALQSDARTLLAASSQRLEFVDGIDGTVLASSPPLEPMVTSLNGQQAPYSLPVAAHEGASSWSTAVPGQTALWHLRLSTSDRIFQGTFDSP